MHNKIKNGVEVEPQTSDSVSLSPGERTAMVLNNPEPHLTFQCAIEMSIRY